MNPKFVERVAERVIELLDKRESDKKDEQVRRAATIAEAERQARLDNLKSYYDDRKNKQEDCKHNDKLTHEFKDGVNRATLCRDCGKVWKDPQPPKAVPRDVTTPMWARPFTKRCNHTYGYDSKSSITEVWDGCTRCHLCMKQWGKVAI